MQFICSLSFHTAVVCWFAVYDGFGFPRKKVEKTTTDFFDDINIEGEIRPEKAEGRMHVLVWKASVPEGTCLI